MDLTKFKEFLNANSDLLQKNRVFEYEDERYVVKEVKLINPCNTIELLNIDKFVFIQLKIDISGEIIELDMVGKLIRKK